MEQETEIEQALALADSSDPDEVVDGVRKLQMLVRDDVNDPRVYDALGKALFDVDPVKHWSTVRNCVKKSVWYSLENAEESSGFAEFVHGVAVEGCRQLQLLQDLLEREEGEEALQGSIECQLDQLRIKRLVYRELQQGDKILFGGMALISNNADDRTEGVRVLKELVDDDVDEPAAYQLLGDYLMEIAPIEAWTEIRHCAIRFVYYSIARTDASNQAEFVGQGYNRLMHLGIALKDEARFTEAVECFLPALRYWLLAYDGSAGFEKFADTPVAYAYDCAEEVDGEGNGETTRRVAELIDELQD